MPEIKASTEPVWTPAQSLAIRARGASLAVSAAAGSGKTAVLTERIVGLLSEEDGVDAARLAVVTFTKKAAAELEEKLYRKLAKAAAETKNPRLQRQLSRLGQAQISTIHSLAFSLVREYKRHLDLPETIKIADDTEAAFMRRSAVDRALKEKMALWKDQDTTSLISLFGTGNSKEPAVKAIDKLLKECTSLERGLLSLCEKYEESLAFYAKAKAGEILFWDTPHGTILWEHLTKTLAVAEETLSQGLVAIQGTVRVSEIYLEPFREMYFGIQEAKKAASARDRKKTAALLSSLTALNLPVARSLPKEERETKDVCRAIWNDWVLGPVKKVLEEVLSDDEEEILRQWKLSLDYVKEILDLAQRSEEIFTAEKREAGLLDYGDLEHLTLSLLARYENGAWVKTPICDAVRENFDAVFVDEYQDTNGVQDRIFRLLAPEDRLFVVGDPKQSIYRFRGAEPSIFAAYKNELSLYKEGKTGMQKILLSNNFRCDKPIVSLVNHIFSRMMWGERDDSLYKSEDHLCYSKKEKEGDPPKKPLCTELCLISKTDPREASVGDEEETEVAREARFLAARISKMLREEERKPSDIAILFRSTSPIPAVKEALEALSIPCSAGGGEEWKEDAEFLFLSSLFSALENPMRDIPLLGALSSPVFRMEEDMAYRIRKGCKNTSFYNALLHASKTEDGAISARCREILEELALLRQRMVRSTLSQFVFFVYSRWSLEELFCQKGRKKGVVKAHILSLCTALENTGSVLVGDLARRMAEAPFEGKGEEKSGVQLMTIHASKGLEFPVVFVSFLSQRFNTRDEYASLLISSKLGGALSVPALGGRAKISPATKRAVRLLLHRDMVEEEKRILYVALTRAEEKLVLTATVKDTKSLALSLLSHPSASPKRLLSPLLETASSHLGLILPCLSEKKALSEILEGEPFSEEGDFAASFTISLPQGEPVSPAAREEARSFAPDAVLAALDFHYPHQEDVSLPNKLSVSRLLARDREEKGGEYYPIRLLDFEKGILRSGAERIGTATHQVMQFCDFSAMEENSEKEFDRLLQKGFLSREDLSLVDRKKVLSFFSSPLYRQMKKSLAVEREKRFNVLLDGRTLGVGEGEVLVQGVVDVWFENPDGSLTLLDFKTDRVKPEDGEEVLRERHSHQLRLYAVAVEKMTGKKVTALAIYSFALEKEIFV